MHLYYSLVLVSAKEPTKPKSVEKLLEVHEKSKNKKEQVLPELVASSPEFLKVVDVFLAHDQETMALN